MPRRTSVLIALLSAVSLGLISGCTESKKLSISGLSPKVGPHHGGDPVTISGTGFQSSGQQGMKIYFGGKPVSRVVIKSDTEIHVEPPSGQIGEEVDVEIIFDDARTAKLPKAYKYIDLTGGKAP